MGFTHWLFASYDVNIRQIRSNIQNKRFLNIDTFVGFCVFVKGNSILAA